MNRARRMLVWIGPAMAAGIVFSPLLSVLFGMREDRGTMIAAIHTAARPLAMSTAVGCGAAIVALVGGSLFALLTEQARPSLRRVLWVLGLLTLIVPPYMVAESAIVLLGPAGKISRGLALWLGVGPPPSDLLARARFTVRGWVYTWPSAAIILGGCLFSIVALTVAAVYRRTDRRIFQAARLARGRWGVFLIGARTFFGPMIGAAMLVFAAALAEYVVPQLLRVPTIGQSIYERIQEGEVGMATALGLTLLPLIILAGALGAFILLRARNASLAVLEGEVPDLSTPSPSILKDSLAIFTTMMSITVAIGLPTVSLAWLALSAKIPPATAGTHQVLRASGFWSSFSGAWSLAHADAIRTAILASVTATLATVAAIFIVRPLSRSKSGAILGVLGAGLAIPAPIVGLGLIALWNRDGAAGWVDQSLGIVMLGWLARFLPVGILFAQASLARVPRELEEAAALMGHGALRRLISVVLPIAAPGLAAAWLATYVLSATEFPATLLIVPPGLPLLAPSVVNLMRRGQDPEIAACQVLLLSVVAAPLIGIAAAAWIRPRWRTR